LINNVFKCLVCILVNEVSLIVVVIDVCRCYHCPRQEYRTRGKTRNIRESRVVNKKRSTPLIADYRQNEELYDFAVKKYWSFSNSG